MTIKDSIVNLKKGLRTTLTNVPALIDTLVRGLDGVAEAAEEENTYSTDEHVVGKWIDGSVIYEKTISTGALPNNGVKDVPHGITNLGKIVEIKGIALASNGTIAASIPITNPGEKDLIAYIYVGGNNIKMRTNTNYSVYDESYITLKYLKSATSRSPEENDTKNGDEEKNNEEVKNER